MQQRPEDRGHQPPEPDKPRHRRERRQRRLHLFSVVRNLLALVGLGFLVVELLRWIIVPYVLVPLGSLTGG